MAYKDVVIVAAVVRCVCTDHSLLVVMAVSWDSCYVFRVFHKITFWIFIIFLFLFTSFMIRWCADPRFFVFLRGRGVGLFVWKLEDVQQPRPYLFILAWRFRRSGRTNMNVSLPFDIQTLAFYMAWSYLCLFNYLSTFRSKVPLIFPILSLSLGCCGLLPTALRAL